MLFKMIKYNIIYLTKNLYMLKFINTFVNQYIKFC